VQAGQSVARACAVKSRQEGACACGVNLWQGGAWPRLAMCRQGEAGGCVRLWHGCGVGGCVAKACDRAGSAGRMCDGQRAAAARGTRSVCIPLHASVHIPLAANGSCCVCPPGAHPSDHTTARPNLPPALLCCPWHPRAPCCLPHLCASAACLACGASAACQPARQVDNLPPSMGSQAKKERLKTGGFLRQEQQRDAGP
jgi:hypothetical protein